jgi:Holliday junction resolvase RusA-like endonuclease
MSVNKAWQGKRFKTPEYKSYEKHVLMLLPSQIEFKAPLRLNLVFGFSSKLSDLDNPIKCFTDCLVKKYNFDDRDIYELNVKKEIVKKGQEFIDFEINEIKSEDL